MFCFPMAGKSSRFFNAGFDKPKHQLTVGKKSVFELVINSFFEYFSSEQFIFICRDEYNNINFIKSKVKKIGLVNYKIITLKEETKGQADTVYQAAKFEKKDDQITIFNIDTILANFKKPNFIHSCDGYLEVFKGEGNHWSFVKPGENNLVLKTTEKNRISDLCSNGLYFFKRNSDFIFCVEKALGDKIFDKELYVAPLYNILINDGKIIRYFLTKKEDNILCGTPEEYEYLKNELT